MTRRGQVSTKTIGLRFPLLINHKTYRLFWTRKDDPSPDKLTHLFHGKLSSKNNNDNGSWKHNCFFQDHKQHDSVSSNANLSRDKKKHNSFEIKSNTILSRDIKSNTILTRNMVLSTDQLCHSSVPSHKSHKSQIRGQQCIPRSHASFWFRVRRNTVLSRDHK